MRPTKMVTLGREEPEELAGSCSVVGSLLLKIYRVKKGFSKIKNNSILNFKEKREPCKQQDGGVCRWRLVCSQLPRPDNNHSETISFAILFGQ